MGDAEAQYAVGSAFLTGDGVEQNSERAFYWILKAAEQGVCDAQADLGVMYSRGDGVQADIAKSVEWHTRAAEQGDVNSQFIVGSLYYDGETAGVAQDNELAEKWLSAAAEQGDAEAQFYLANLYAYKMQPANMEEAVRWLKTAADRGNAEAQNLYGLFLKDGEGVEKDQVQAIDYIAMAANQGYAQAQYNMGCAYLNGVGREKDMQQAIEWFEYAAQQGDVDAEYTLGVFYFDGIGVVKDIRRAIAYFSSAAQKGHSDASYYLGIIGEVPAESNEAQDCSGIEDGETVRPIRRRSEMTMENDWTCEFCGKSCEAGTTPWYAFDIQRGKELVCFCSEECLRSWKSKKQTMMIVTLALGLLLTLLAIGEMGGVAILLLFIPYMLRQAGRSLGEIASMGWLGEMFAFIVTGLGSFTFIYPIIKIVQEIKEYRRIGEIL